MGFSEDSHIAFAYRPIGWPANGFKSRGALSCREALVRILRLRVGHPCPIAGPIGGAGGVRGTHLCHRGREAMFEFHAARGGEIGPLLEEYRARAGDVLALGEDGRSALVRFPSCPCCRTGAVIPTVERHRHLFLPPSYYDDQGTESYQFLVREPELSKDLLAELSAAVRVEAFELRPLAELGFEGGFLVPVGTLFAGLSSRQREAVLVALRRGFYRVPRSAGAEELARELGVSAAAVHMLLRKAESRLFRSLLPYLAVGAAPDPPAEPPAGGAEGESDAGRRAARRSFGKP